MMKLLLYTLVPHRESLSIKEISTKIDLMTWIFNFQRSPFMRKRYEYFNFQLLCGNDVKIFILNLKKKNYFVRLVSEIRKFWMVRRYAVSSRPALHRRLPRPDMVLRPGLTAVRSPFCSFPRESLLFALSRTRGTRGCSPRARSSCFFIEPILSRCLAKGPVRLRCHP